MTNEEFPFLNMYLFVISSCKRIRKLAREPIVLRNVSHHAFSVHASSWCDRAHQFLSHCAEAGNMDACYMLGMVCAIVVPLNLVNFSCWLRLWLPNHWYLKKIAGITHLLVVMKSHSGLNFGPGRGGDPPKSVPFW
jgi:hypothetical protein